MKRRTLGIAVMIGSLALVLVGAIALIPDSTTSGDIESVEAALRPSTSAPVLPLTEPSPTTTVPPAEPVPTQDIEQELPPIAPPIGLRIDSLGVDAPVDPYGVDRATGQMAVPDNVTDVGWYEYGPRPGEPGSSVLAAHVDLAGSGPGVFFDLRTLVEGDRITVLHEDGSESPFRVVARSTYEKEELPLEVIFSREGPSVLTLITCGGGFNSNVSRYDSNVVVYAVPDLGNQPTEGTSL